jgi:molybdate transport system regulatory protein
MKVSARNQLHGTVTKLIKGMVNTEVDLTLDGGDTIVAVITNKGAENLGLAEGSKAFAIIKATCVILSKGSASDISARNNLCGKVQTLIEGQVNTEVDIELPGGNVITAILTNEGAKKMQLTEGGDICAIFKASNVILGV